MAPIQPIARRPSRARFLLPTLFLALWGSTAPLLAQSSPPQRSSASGVELITEAPYEIPSLGLSVFLPKDSLVDLSRVQGGRTAVIIRPQGAETTWIIQIQNSISSDHSLTLDAALKNIVAQRETQYTRKDDRGRSTTLVRTFGRADDLMIGPHRAQRVYLDVPTRPEVPATGYTLFQTGPGQFVIFQIDCATSAFPTLQTLYETMVATVQFRDPSEMQADRAAAILAGQALLNKVNSADLIAALDDKPIYYRLYKPSKTGAPGDAEELGYQRIQVKAGKAGELDPSKSQSRWTAADRAEGFIVRIDARSLTMGSVVDSVSIFFLSQDRASELWSITMLVRKDGQSEQWIETGIRRDKQLTVKTVRSGSEPTSADWSPLPDGYISRVESYLLSRLAVRAKTPGLFGFYAYESALGKMTLRRDTFDLSEAGVWTCVTQQSENSPAIKSQLDANGLPTKRELPDGGVMEPIEVDRLRRIWKDKRLPMD